MNVTPFNFEGFQVRTVLNENTGETWFVAKDVCEALLISNGRDALSRLDKDEKSTVVISDTIQRGNPNHSIINESGLYNLVMTSRKPEAKRFKKWVLSEVLPSIRKTGSYSVIQQRIPQTYGDALELALKQVRLVEQQSILLEQQEALLEQQSPKVHYYDTVGDTTGLRTATQVGQKIKLSGVELNKRIDRHLDVYSKNSKRGRVFKMWFVNSGYGEMITTEGGFSQALFTAKGEQYIVEKLTF